MNPYLSFSHSSSPWTEEQVYSNHVSIGTHKLGMYISGHPSHLDKPNVPNELIIFFGGAGDVHQSWGPVRKVIEVWNRWSETNTQCDPRILLYDRSGLGESERGPNRLTATNAASELLTALRVTGLLAHHKSLILVAHSYGAIVAREFLHLLESEPSGSSPPSSPFDTSAKDEPPTPTIKLEAYEDHQIIQIPNVPTLEDALARLANPTKSSTEERPIKLEDLPEWSSTSQKQDPSKSSPDNSNRRAKIKALVLVDPSTEHQHLYFPHPNPDITALIGNLNFARVTGLRENALNSNHMTKEDWRARAIALSTPSSLAASAEEVSNYVEVCTTLAEKRQLERHVLGDRPLVILQAESWKEYEAIYAAGVEAGNGTVEERQRFRELLDSWKENDCKLKEELLGLTTHYGADVNIKTDRAGSTVEPIRVVLYEEDSRGRLHVDTGWDTQVTNQQSEAGWGNKNCKLVTVKNCGHNIQLIRPELVVWEIVWALTIVRREQEETDACVERKQQERKRKRTRANEQYAKDGKEVTKKASL